LFILCSTLGLFLTMKSALQIKYIIIIIMLRLSELAGKPS